MNNTPRAIRPHIAVFGNRNAGKSSIINAITNQNLSIVSDIAGTTTDPVLKSMELLPIGPVVFIDTAGLDDEGTLGKLRIEKTYEVLNKADIALVVIDNTIGVSSIDKEIIEKIREKKIPFILVINKCDLDSKINYDNYDNYIKVSALKNINIEELKVKISTTLKVSDVKILDGLVAKNDVIILVTPIDSSAPKGRIILPQQQILREILDNNAISIVVQECELKQTLSLLKEKPKLIITDSQVFSSVFETIKDTNIELTSFSILFAKFKGNIDVFIKGAKSIEKLKENDFILISEGCTHHRQKDDIATSKIPRWLENLTKKKLNFDFSSGHGFPKDIKKYKLVIHCGSCMLNKHEVTSRVNYCIVNNIPITNFGVFIAYYNGILDLSTRILKNKSR